MKKNIPRLTVECPNVKLKHKFRSKILAEGGTMKLDVEKLMIGYLAGQFKIKFPDKTNGFGPGTRAGDFGEILIADYLEYIMGYWVPRTRYGNKVIRNESIKGSDTIGFKLDGNGEDSPDDALAIYEVKTQFSGRKPKPRLQDAINDSAKDFTRRAESLNAIKQRLFESGQLDKANLVDRFQNLADRPYAEEYGAVALFSDAVFSEKDLGETDASDHISYENLVLLVIQGTEMMKLAHALYIRAANEA